MESVGGISENEWSSFSAMYAYDESEFMVQLFSNYSAPNDFDDGSSFGAPSCWPDHERVNNAGVQMSSMYCLDNMNANANVSRLSLGSTASYDDGSSSFFCPPASNNDSYFSGECSKVLWTSNDSVLDYYIGGPNGSCGEVYANNLEDTSNGVGEESGVRLREAGIRVNSQCLESEAQLPEPEQSKEVELKNPMHKSKKRLSKAGNVQMNKRNVKSRNKEKLNSISKTEEDTVSAVPVENSSSYFSEDDSNACHESNGGASTLDTKAAVAVGTNDKTRANRGSATDPQSLYARKRRERINERLRTLQSLVPNGTKVDISTMLEEAVQYVKFLQFQIKLLSSDDLWMYAPIAYNGMNLGLDMNITMPRR